MRNSTCLFFLISFSISLNSCQSENKKTKNVEHKAPELSKEFNLKVDKTSYKGSFIVKEGSLFNANAILTPFLESDSSYRNVTLLNFEPDSIYLRKWNPGRWNGKGMFGYDACEWKMNEDTLQMTFTLPISRATAKNSLTIFNFTATKNERGEIKLVRCGYLSSRDVMIHLGRGGRDFTKEGGEEIRSDIQLR